MHLIDDFIILLLSMRSAEVRFLSEPYLHLHVNTIINKSTIKL